MTKTTLRLGLSSMLFAIAAAGGCDCEDDLVEIPKATCDLATSCKTNQAYRYGTCVSTYCEDDAECCPGTYCNVASNACQANTILLEYECQTDIDCLDRLHDPALYCVRESGATAGVCRYQACRRDDECAPGASCFKNWCVARAPCSGTCPDGQVCEVGSNRCHPVDKQKGCSGLSCAPGQLLVLENPDVMTGDICCPVICHCASLPPLQPGVVGRFASVAVGAGEVLVSAYDETFGDLVVAHYTSQADLKWLSYVDGVPATGELGGDPNGPRRGIITPGPDVGLYTSLVVNGRGEPRVAYYDQDNGDLRMALFDLASGGWSVHVVDAERDAGRYASMVLDPVSGRLRVAYMVSGLTLNGHAATALRVATSRNEHPQSSADWQLSTVETAEVRDPCDDSCGASRVCVLENGAPGCGQPRSDCQPGCASGQSCVDDGGNPRCKATLPPDLAGLPRGVGLFASLIRTATDDVVVYYDGLRGDLRGARISATGPQAPVVINGDGVDGRHGGDVGRFASVAFDGVSNTLGVAYEDVTRHTLRFYRGVDLHGGGFEVIEDGAAHPPGVSFVGADAAMGYLPDGSAVVVYQDASFMDLAMARRDAQTGTWRRERLLAEGAFGFDTAVAVTPSVAYVASAAPRVDARRLLASRLLLFLRPLLP
ncbi:MAG: hypothetical protein ABIJ09_15550 [Pseudomonadota bacterium]